MNILVAVDLSPASSRVVEAAGRVAKLTGAKVYLLHAAEPEPDFVGYDAGPEVVRTQVAHELRREHRDVQALAEELRNDGLDATALLVPVLSAGQNYRYWWFPFATVDFFWTDSH